MLIDIRLAREQDLPQLPQIERAAGQVFASVGMPEIAADPPPDQAWYHARLDAGLLWVAATSRGN